MKKKIISIKNKNIFISGAYGYIASKIAIDLASEGANLIINGKNLSKLNKLKKKISMFNNKITIANFDITDSLSLKKFFSKEYKLPLNSIIHNSNYVNIGGLSNVNEDDYINSYKVSVIAADNLIKFAKGHLLKASKKSNFSSFINIGSIYGSLSPFFDNYGSEKYFNPPNYGASKSALTQWTRYAACQYGKYGIRFNTISPGPIPNINKKINKKFLQKLLKKIPVRKFGKPEDLSGIIIYLCSNSSQFINGSNIVIDGGWSAW
jgi:NAD(P)-dependent dehydrogenase (short-subunit alcohol dehydrogenase family)